MKNTHYGKCLGRIYQGKGREDDRKLDGKRCNPKSTGLRASDVIDRATWNRKIISHNGDPISSRPT